MIHLHRWIERICEAARQRWLLRSLAAQYVDSRHYSGELAPAVSRKLQRLDRKGFVLALRIFAYDARMTTAAIIELSRRGEANEARLEKSALAARSLNGWALKTVGLAQPHDSLLELAAQLRIGLGPELRQWLLEPDDWVVGADAWLREYGPRIEHFETTLR